MNITDEAVEAAAFAIFGVTHDSFVDEWVALHPAEREIYKRQARVALAAASPFIADSTLKAAAEALMSDKAPHRHLNNTIYAAWLTERAGQVGA